MNAVAHDISYSASGRTFDINQEPGFTPLSAIQEYIYLGCGSNARSIKVPVATMLVNIRITMSPFLAAWTQNELSFFEVGSDITPAGQVLRCLHDVWGVLQQLDSHIQGIYRAIGGNTYGKHRVQQSCTVELDGLQDLYCPFSLLL